MNVPLSVAHPDDEMSCLGTLLLYRRRGDTLSLVCATNGDKGMSDDPEFPTRSAPDPRRGNGAGGPCSSGLTTPAWESRMRPCTTRGTTV